MRAADILGGRVHGKFGTGLGSERAGSGVGGGSRGLEILLVLVMFSHAVELLVSLTALHVGLVLVIVFAITLSLLVLMVASELVFLFDGAIEGAERDLQFLVEVNCCRCTLEEAFAVSRNNKFGVFFLSSAMERINQRGEGCAYRRCS